MTRILAGLLVGLAILLFNRALLAQTPSTEGLETDSPSIDYLFGGGGRLSGGTFALDRRASAYEYSYTQSHVLGPLGVQLSYLNQGHITDPWPWYWPVQEPLHYRDSYAALLDAWSPKLAHCRLGAAAGPETYFDTTTSQYRTHYENRHGLGLRTSVSAECYPLRALAIELQAGRSFDLASYDSSYLLVGLRYMPGVGGSGFPPGAGAGDYVDLVGGQTDLDSFRVEQQNGNIEWLTYGHTFWGPLALELSALAEDVSGYLQRRSVATQLVIAHSFATHWLQLFAGVGPSFGRTNALVNGPCYGYAPVCNEGTREIYSQMNLLYEYGFKVAFSQRLAAVVKLGRVGSASGRTDTDLVTAGLQLALQ